jgi:hypothetical protein
MSDRKIRLPVFPGVGNFTGMDYPGRRAAGIRISASSCDAGSADAKQTLEPIGIQFEFLKPSGFPFAGVWASL